MFQSRLIFKVLFFPLLLVSLASCAKTKVVYRGTYKGQAVKIIQSETVGLFAVANSITYLVQLGKHNRIPIGPENVDFYGAPYDTTIYRGIPHQFFENTITNQQTTPVGNSMVVPSMLYFDPKKYNKETYEDYADFFAHAWPAINKEFNTNYPYIKKQIIGTVWGAQLDFVQLFVGQEEGRSYYFDVQPDGSIGYHEGGGPSQSTGIQGSGLAQAVEMPGHIIRIEYPEMLNREKLRRYKDKAGKSMEDYFSIVEGKK